MNMEHEQVHTQKFPYTSKGVKIVQSIHHKGMFILNYPDGGFINIHSSPESMLLLHPADKTRFIVREKFNYSATSNYKPNKVKREYELTPN